MRHSRKSAAVLGIALLFPSCTDNGFEPIVDCADDQQVTMNASLGTVPRFTWEPSCGMASVWVWEDQGPIRWALYSGEHAPENPLPSGLRYGQVPPKGVEPTSSVLLQRGVTYRVTVYRWVGQPGGPGSLFERGSTTFRP